MDHSQEPLTRALRIMGVTTSAFLSGYSFAASNYAIPAVALAPIPLRIQQWERVYTQGKFVSPPLAAISGISWGILATQSYKRGDDAWVSEALAGALTFGGVLLWTLVAIRPTNNVLLNAVKVGGTVAADGAWAKGMEREIAKWAKLNTVRFVAPMIATLVGALSFV